MDFNDPIPGLVDRDGSPVTVAEALVRGNWAYRSVTEGGSTDDRLDILEQGD